MIGDHGKLHYKGDCTKDLEIGELLGRDETFRLMEVEDFEYDPKTDRTTVYLKYATPETMMKLQQKSQGGSN